MSTVDKKYFISFRNIEYLLSSQVFWLGYLFAFVDIIYLNQHYLSLDRFQVEFQF